MRSFSRLVRFLRQTRIEVAQSFDFYTNIMLMPAARLAGVPVFIASHRQARRPPLTDKASYPKRGISLGRLRCMQFVGGRGSTDKSRSAQRKGNRNLEWATTRSLQAGSAGLTIRAWRLHASE